MGTRTSLLRFRLLAALSLPLVAACGADPTGPGDPGDPGSPPPAVASIRVEPDAPALGIGQTVRLLATPLSALGHELVDRPVTWQSSDTTKAVVTADGWVTAVAAGAVPLTVTSEAVSRQVVLTVLPVPPAYVWLPTSTVALVEEETLTLQVEVRDSLDRPLDGLAVDWISLDASVATVDASGRVTARRRGATYVVARHGALEAAARIDVRDFLTADVLYHATDATVPYPRVYRADPNDPEGEPQPVFGSAGTWQVAVSPDGSRLAFVCTDPNPAICVSNADGSGVQGLTTGGDLAYEDHPTWSPDGQRIAFRRWPQGGTPGQAAITDIWVMDADGSNQTNLTNDPEMQHEPAWSPVLADGSSRIAYSQAQLLDGYLTSRVFTMKADGSDRRAETPHDGRIAAEPAWSPDGSEIAYFNNGGEVFGDLWVTRVGLREERPLLAAPLDGEQHAPAWSPDGRYVAFTSEHELTDGTAYRSQVYTVRSDGTDVVRRSGGMAHKHDPAWIVRP